MQILVSADIPISIRRAKGSTVTFINQNAVGRPDFYLSEDRNQLIGPNWATVPLGAKLAANGNALQYPNFSGVMWVRASAAPNATDNGMEVLP